MSPSWRVPCWIRTVATGPRPRSSLASTTTPRRRPVRIGLQLHDLGLQRRHLEELLDPGALLGGRVHEDRLAAPVLGNQSVVHQLLPDPVRGGVRLVHLVHGDDDRDARRLGVIDRLHRLRHDAVVGRHDQDHDVGGLRATGAHGGEGFVAGRVQERDLAVARLHLIGPDVLRDAAELLLGDPGLPDGVEERRLPVVDVPHDRDDRGPREKLGGIGLLLEQIRASRPSASRRRSRIGPRRPWPCRRRAAG